MPKNGNDSWASQISMSRILFTLDLYVNIKQNMTGKLF